MAPRAKRKQHWVATRGGCARAEGLARPGSAPRGVSKAPAIGICRIDQQNHKHGRCRARVVGGQPQPTGWACTARRNKRAAERHTAREWRVKLGCRGSIAKRRIASVGPWSRIKQIPILVAWLPLIGGAQGRALSQRHSRPRPGGQQAACTATCMAIGRQRCSVQCAVCSVQGV